MRGPSAIRFAPKHSYKFFFFLNDLINSPFYWNMQLSRILTGVSRYKRMKQRQTIIACVPFWGISRLMCLLCFPTFPSSFTLFPPLHKPTPPSRRSRRRVLFLFNLLIPFNHLPRPAGDDLDDGRRRRCHSSTLLTAPAAAPPPTPPPRG